MNRDVHRAETRCPEGQSSGGAAIGFAERGPSEDDVGVGNGGFG